MRKIFFCALSTILFCCYSLSFADTCPSVESLKQGKTPGWKFYDSEDGTPLTAKQVAEYKGIIVKFVLAEWQDKASTIHCYYSDKDGSGLEAYVAKSNFVPDKSKNWYTVTGASQCVAGTNECQFADKNKSFAKR